MDNLARFYTRDIFSSLLVRNISIPDPKIIIDLGIGSGSLTNAAFQKWENATFLATDIDKKQIEKTGGNYPFVRIVLADGLEQGICKKLNIKVGSADVAICNPPYLKVESKNTQFSSLFSSVGLKNCMSLKYLTSDMIFLAQNLLLLRKGGELGIIIPDGLLTNSEFRVFRQDLLSNHGIVSVIQLPESIFKGTEARTHILILKKGVPNNRKVDLFLADKMGKFVDKVTVNQTLLLDRMDFYFHKHSQDYKIRKRSVTLGDLMVDIKRGQLTHSQLKNEQFYIHTTTLKHLKEIRLRSNKNSFNKNYVQTAKGDILLARVGRGCIGKVSLVNRGIQPISDCVYRIRVPREYVRDVWKSLTSEEGQKWLRARAHGVCAKVLSKQDLTKLPIIISSENNKNK